MGKLLWQRLSGQRLAKSLSRNKRGRKVLIKRVSVENFKSFNDLDIELRQFNVLIGANASGKTNFIQFFKFLQDIVNHGLDNAVSMQGGIEYLRNINIGQKRDLSATITYANVDAIVLRKEDSLVGMRIYETTYEFILNFVNRD